MGEPTFAASDDEPLTIPQALHWLVNWDGEVACDCIHPIDTPAFDALVKAGHAIKAQRSYLITPAGRPVCGDEDVDCVSAYENPKEWCSNCGSIIDGDGLEEPRTSMVWDKPLVDRLRSTDPVPGMREAAAAEIERARIADLAEKWGLHLFAAHLRGHQTSVTAAPAPTTKGSSPSPGAAEPETAIDNMGRRCARCGSTFGKHLILLTSDAVPEVRCPDGDGELWALA